MMAHEDTPSPLPSGLSKAEREIRRFEAWLGFWKIVLGTFLVGIAGVFVPAAVTYTNNWFEHQRKQTEIELEDKRKQTELNLSQQAAHQQYIKDFFETAINQNIELRIRFANYFAKLSGPEQGVWWEKIL